jgi:hypothetical protein
MVNTETEIVLDTVHCSLVGQYQYSQDEFDGGMAKCVASDYFLDESPKYDYLLNMLDDINWDWIAEQIIATTQI